MTDILTYSIIIWALIVFTILIVIGIIYLYLKRKVKKQKDKVYKYKNYNLKLIRNTLGVKKALYFLLKQDFRKAVEDANTELGFEYVKPFDFTKIREQNVMVSDLLGAIVIICEKKELLPQIFKLFIEGNYEYDFEKDYAVLSSLAEEILQDFFFENWVKII